jgi:predicted RNase H-like HicB family nuclease
MKDKHLNTIHLPILVEQDEDKMFIVSCPVFKGCHSYGRTIEEALENIQQVVEICLAEEKENYPLSDNLFIGFRELQLPYTPTSA